MKPLAAFVVHPRSSLMKTSKLIFCRGLIVATFLTLAAIQAGCVSIVDSTTPGVVLYLRGELQVNIDRRFDTL